MNIRWIVFVIMFFLICTLISNIIDKQDVYTTAQIDLIQQMRSQQFTEAKEPDLGGVTTAGENPLDLIDAIWTAMKMDYSFLYDVRYDMTEAQCEAAVLDNRGVSWDEDISACQIPNVWWTLWLIMIYGPMVGVAFYFAIQLWKAVTGRG